MPWPPMNETALPFDVTWVERRAPTHPHLDELLAWAHRFHALGWTPSYGPGDHGNMSVRSAAGCVVTATRTSKAAITREECVEVVGWAERAGRTVVSCRGLRPQSTDAVLHYELYRRHPALGAVLHGHDAQALNQGSRLRLPVVSGASALELLPHVARLVPDRAYVLIAGHGFLAFGPSLEAAGQAAVSVHEKSLTAAHPAW